MSILIGLMADFSQWLRPWMPEIANALVVSVLVIWGDRLHKSIKIFVKGFNFVVRTLVFVGLCAFGYGLVTAFLSPFLAKLFLSLGNVWMGLVVAVSFIAVGWMAEKHNYS